MFINSVKNYCQYPIVFLLLLNTFLLGIENLQYFYHDLGMQHVFAFQNIPIILINFSKDNAVPRNTVQTREKKTQKKTNCMRDCPLTANRQPES